MEDLLWLIFSLYFMLCAGQCSAYAAVIQSDPKLRDDPRTTPVGIIILMMMFFLSISVYFGWVLINN